MAHERAAAIALAGLGVLALALGVLVYASDRPATHAQWFPAVAALHAGPMFGTMGAWLPSLVHPFAFSLFTAAALPRSASPAYGACALWWTVNAAFELGQHALLRERLHAWLLEVFGTTAMSRSLSNYFLRGHFDTGDLVAVTVGALAACMVLRAVHRWEMRRARG